MTKPVGRIKCHIDGNCYRVTNGKGGQVFVESVKNIKDNDIVRFVDYTGLPHKMTYKEYLNLPNQS